MLSKVVFLFVSSLVLGSLAGCAGSTVPGDETSSGDEALSASAPITLHNWLNHPKIVAVRKQVEAIEASHLQTEKKELCKDEPVGEFERDKGTDASGKIRKLVLQVGGEDGAMIDTYYYDASGKMIFVFETQNDVHGNSSEERVYFDASGARLWDVYRNAHDPHNNPDVSHAPFEVSPAPLDIAPELANPGQVFDGPPRCD
jgi:hypothetical protein